MITNVLVLVSQICNFSPWLSFWSIALDTVKFIVNQFLVHGDQFFWGYGNLYCSPAYISEGFLLYILYILSKNDEHVLTFALYMQMLLHFPLQRHHQNMTRGLHVLFIFVTSLFRANKWRYCTKLGFCLTEAGVGEKMERKAEKRTLNVSFLTFVCCVSYHDAWLTPVISTCLSFTRNIAFLFLVPVFTVVSWCNVGYRQQLSAKLKGQKVH